MNVKSVIKLASVVIIALALVNCKSKKNAEENLEEVSDLVVLKVGNIEITKYEFEKNKARYFSAESGVSLQEWTNSFIDETYMIADAYEKKFDTLPNVIKLVDYTSHAMVSQIGGYLWNKLAEPQLVFTDEEIKDTYEKRGVVYYVEYLQFPDVATLNKVLNNDTILNNEADFIRIVNICRSHNTVKYDNRAFVYPFDELANIREDIYKLEKGDVTKLLKTNNGIYAVHLLKREATKQQSFSDEKEQIGYILRDAKSNQIINEQNKKVFGSTNIKIDEKNENRLFEIMKRKEIRTYLSSQSKDTILSYSLNGKRNNVLIKDYLEYYTNAPFVPVIEEKQELRASLDNYVMEQFEFAQADSLGILKEKRFALDQKNFTYRVILDNYNLLELSNKIEISDNELQDYYKKSDKYTEAETCYITLFVFKTQRNAFENQNYLDEKLQQGDFSSFNDSTIVKGLISYQTDVVINKNDKSYPQQLIQNIFKSPIKVLSGVQEFNNSSALFLKTKEEGKQVKSFNDMKNDIKDIIVQQKYTSMKLNRINELKAKYPISINKL